MKNTADKLLEYMNLEVERWLYRVEQVKIAIMRNLEETNLDNDDEYLLYLCDNYVKASEELNRHKSILKRSEERL